jgi:hypothetical protein
VVYEGLDSEVCITALRADLTCQELGRGVAMVGRRGWITHREIMQRQRAYLYTGFV